MSPQQQQEAIDRLKREFEDCDRQMKLERIELERIGKALEAIGKQLQQNPVPPLQFDDVTPGANRYFDHIQERLDRVIALQKELKRLRNHLESVGVPSAYLRAFDAEA